MNRRGVITLLVLAACAGSDGGSSSKQPLDTATPPTDLAATIGTVDVLTFQYNLARTGVASRETTLTPANVNATSFGKTATFAVDGYVYAQPLYVSERAI